MLFFFWFVFFRSSRQANETVVHARQVAEYILSVETAVLIWREGLAQTALVFGMSASSFYAFALGWRLRPSCVCFVPGQRDDNDETVIHARQSEECFFLTRLHQQLIWTTFYGRLVSEPRLLPDWLPKFRKRFLFEAAHGAIVYCSSCCFQNSSRISQRSLGCRVLEKGVIGWIIISSICSPWQSILTVSRQCDWWISRCGYTPRLISKMQLFVSIGWMVIRQ